MHHTVMLSWFQPMLGARISITVTIRLMPLRIDENEKRWTV